MRAAARPGRVALLALIVALSPTAARGDWVFTPFFFGSSFGADTSYLTTDPLSSQAIYGGSAAWLMDSGLGVEGDLAIVPGFYEGERELIMSSSVMSLFGNVIVAAPLRITRESLRPYAVGGLGLIRSNAEETFPVGVFEISDRVLGLQLGGGAIGFVSERIGLRFDLRHTRAVRRGTDDVTPERKTKVSFWRAAVGVVLRY